MLQSRNSSARFSRVRRLGLAIVLIFFAAGTIQAAPQQSPGRGAAALSLPDFVRDVFAEIWRQALGEEAGAAEEAAQDSGGALEILGGRTERDSEIELEPPNPFAPQPSGAGRRGSAPPPL